MIFKEIYKIWKGKNLLKDVLKEIDEMYKINEEMFKIVINALFKEEKIEIDIYREDRKINRYEMNIRKRILEHLAVSPYQDVTASLILIGVVRDIERIGDFCKNILELSCLYGKKLSKDSYVNIFDGVVKQIEEMFKLTKEAFGNSDIEKGKIVMDKHSKEIAPNLSRLIEDIINDKDIKVKEAVIYVLLSRYLKRVSAHLMNIASSVVNPFHKIRHRRDGYLRILEKNVPAWKSV